VQPARRLDRDDRNLLAGVTSHQPLELVDACPQDGQRQRLDQQTSRVGAQPDPVLHLARVDRDHEPVNRQCPLKKIAHHAPNPLGNVGKTLSPRRLETYQLRPASTCRAITMRCTWFVPS
jgi:hypothetical protein